MRSAIIVACGFLLWGLCLAAAKLLTGAAGPPPRTATVVFVVMVIVLLTKPRGLFGKAA